jgi:hypothetical protein
MREEGLRVARSVPLWGGRRAVAHTRTQALDSHAGY